MRHAHSLAILFALLADSAVADELVTIPLKSIWALNMPGTRDVRDLDSGKPPSLVEAIRKALAPPQAGTKKTDPGFAVRGKDGEALQLAYEALAGNQQPQKQFAAGSEISAVFFSRQFGPFVHLHRVERRGSEITIRYRFVPHESEVVKEHFALIPLGKLPAGKYAVKIINSPMAKTFINKGFNPISKVASQGIVCGSFNFGVK